MVFLNFQIVKKFTFKISKNFPKNMLIGVLTTKQLHNWTQNFSVDSLYEFGVSPRFQIMEIFVWNFQNCFQKFLNMRIKKQKSYVIRQKILKILCGLRIWNRDDHKFSKNRKFPIRNFQKISQKFTNMHINYQRTTLSHI